MPKPPARSVRQVRVGSMRGVKPRPTGQTLSLPKDRQDNPGLIARRRTLSDAADAEPAMTCVTESAQTTGSFHAAACQKPRQPASRCQSFVLSHVSALRLSRQGARNRPPATRNRSRALPARATTAPHRSRDPVCFPTGVTVRIRQRMAIRIAYPRSS